MSQLSSFRPVDQLQNFLCFDVRSMWLDIHTMTQTRKINMFGNINGTSSLQISTQCAMKMQKSRYIVCPEILWTIKYSRNKHFMCVIPIIFLFQSPASQSAKTSASLFADCSHTLDNILKIRTESVVDGIMNVWIIKPGSSSRGRGKTHFSYLYHLYH